MVIPKKHVEQFYGLDDKDLFKFFKAVKVVALKIKKVYNPDFVLSRIEILPGCMFRCMKPFNQRGWIS